MNRFCSTHAWAALALFVGIAGPNTHAAAQGVPLDSFTANRFAPAPGEGNYLQVDGASIFSHLQLSAGLTLDYAHEPLVVFDVSCTDATENDCTVGDARAELVSYALMANVWAAFTLSERIQISLVLPVGVVDGEGLSDFDRTRGTVNIAGGAAFGLGDLRLGLKARIFGERDDVFRLGAAAFATLPMSDWVQSDRFLGDPVVTVGGHLIAQIVTNGFHVSLNVGGFWRDEQTLLSTSQGSQVYYRAAVGYEVHPQVLVFGEVDGATGLVSDFDENPLEGRVGARASFGDVQLTLAGGAGILAGVGVPVVRVIGGVAYVPQGEAPAGPDTDADGVADSADGCPDEAEDQDGFEDEDGCPDRDNDGDGVWDNADDCPDQAEDQDGFEDANGCPDPDNDGDGVPDSEDACPEAAMGAEPSTAEGTHGCPALDTDGDGILDMQDACPEQPEDPDDVQDEDGCPETDADGDGVLDEADQCDDAAETMNGILDEDGCPEADSDGDGIVDDRDRCPEEAETFNGRRDDDGCPDGEALIAVEGDHLVLLQKIQFATSRARIRSRSRPILRAVASILEQHPEYTHVRVEGHTDNSGDEESNQALSQARAEAVVDALVRLGIARERLHAQGFGQSRPIQDNGTEEGREANRRVEFIIEAPGAAAE